MRSVAWPSTTRSIGGVNAKTSSKPKGHAHDWLMEVVEKRLRKELAKLQVEINEEKGRGLPRWSAEELAGEAALGLATIRRAEGTENESIIMKLPRRKFLQVAVDCLPKTIRRRLGKVRRHIAASMEFRTARPALLGCSSFSAAEKEMLRKVSLRISMVEDMYIPGEAQQYLGAGLSAMRSITRVLDHLRTNRSSIRSVLDLPSGGGRVLRFLKIAFPDADLVACDMNEALVEFCGKAFGARAVRSVPDFNQLQLPGTFDLIWCGSLLTHIDETRCTNLLRFFYNHLSPEGVCIFSTHGKTAIGWLRNGEFNYGLSRLAEQSLLSQVTDFGFGYVNYDGQSEYGLSMVERDRIVALAERAGKWTLAASLESGWDNFHDVYAFTKRDIAPLNDAPQKPLHPYLKWWEI